MRIAKINVKHWKGTAVGEKDRNAYLERVIEDLRTPGSSNFAFMFTGDCLIVGYRDDAAGGTIQVWDTYVRREGEEEEK